MALDIGQARIGLAVGEAGSSFVFGRGYLKRSKLAEDLEYLREKAEEEQVKAFVLGLPLDQNGQQSKQSQRVQAFGRELASLGLPIHYQDERFTSLVAQQGILASGANKRRRQDKGLVDEGAAILILENFLQNQPNPQDIL